MKIIVFGTTNTGRSTAAKKYQHEFMIDADPVDLYEASDLKSFLSDPADGVAVVYARSVEAIIHRYSLAPGALAGVTLFKAPLMNA